MPFVLAFAAPSGTGKTTLIEAVVRVLVGRGRRVAVLKSDAHRVVLDTPGKDSWRFSEAGANRVAVVSAERMALFARLDGDVALLHVVDQLFPDADIVLAEGFRSSGLPSLRVHRRGGPAPTDWTPPRNLVGWVTDEPERLVARDQTEPSKPQRHDGVSVSPGSDPSPHHGSALPTSPIPSSAPLPILPLGDPAAVADWIEAAAAEPRRARPLTVVLPVAVASGIPAAQAAGARFGAVLGAPFVLVLAPGLPAATAPAVWDLRPQLGLLGALYTGLATADTPEVLLVGPRHYAAPPALVRGLVAAGPSRADLVHLVENGHPEPALARYGYRCLSGIQAALLEIGRAHV